jgi:hypothetical protein
MMKFGIPPAVELQPRNKQTEMSTRSAREASVLVTKKYTTTVAKKQYC